MENVNDHSKAKLALAILTSPGAAFEEIARRRLLGSALAIVALTGLAAAAQPIIFALHGNPLQLLMLGKCNPIVWLGACMLYAFAMQKLLKWLGTQIDYVPLLTLIGWSQVALLLSQVFWAIVAYSEAGQDARLVQIGFAGSILFSLWYVALMGPAVTTLSGAPKARGILAYIVIELAAVIGLTFTYTNRLMSGFGHALPEVTKAAGSIAALDQIPWLGAAVVGLAMGLWQIGKHLGWTESKIKINAGAAGLVGLALMGAYWQALSQNNYLGTLARVPSAYIDGRYKAAAQDLETVLGVSKDNAALILDTANLFYLAGDDTRSLFYCRKAADIVTRQSGTSDKQTLAVLGVYRGIALDASGQHEKALSEFEKAAKQWPEFREPPVRMAITYDRMGKYDEAIRAGNRAVLKLGSKSPVVWVALLEAFANTGDKKQTGAAMANLAGNNKDMAKRTGSNPQNWRSAVDKLTRKDLEFPLESEWAPKPEPPKKKK